jgi:phasin family protein
MAAKKKSGAKTSAAYASAKTAKFAGSNFYDLPNNETMEKFMSKGKNQFEKLSQDAAAASKEHAEALVKSGNIFAKGFEDFLKTYSALAQGAAERNTQAFKALLGSKTLNEYTETQSRVAQENLDDFLSGVTKLSELTVKIATDTFEPINDQVSKSIKKSQRSNRGLTEVLPGFPRHDNRPRPGATGRGNFFARGACSCV